jgi:hypothetical protein
VENAEKADLRAQVLRICRDRLQGLGCRSEQQIVHLPFVLQAQLGEGFWQRKDDMKIFARQEFSLTFFQPRCSGQRLTLGAMAIRTGVVRVSFVAALITSFQVTAEGRCATQFDRAHHPLLPCGQRGSVRLVKLGAVGAHDIGDFQRWPHWRRGLGFWISKGQRQQI